MRNLDESNQNILFPKIRVPFFYFLKKGREDVPRQLHACTDLMITLKHLTLGFYAQVLQKWIIIAVPQSSLFFFFCVSNCLFRFFIYLTPFEMIFALLPLLRCSQLLSISSAEAFAFESKNLILLSFFSIRRFLQQMKLLLSTMQD